MIGRIVKHARRAVHHARRAIRFSAVAAPEGPICGQGCISRVLAVVNNDPEVLGLLRQYGSDPTSDLAHQLRQKAMAIIMKRTRGHMNPQVVASIVREEYPNVW